MSARTNVKADRAGGTTAGARADARPHLPKGARHFGDEVPAFMGPIGPRDAWRDPLDSWHRPLTLPLAGVRIA